MASKKIECTRNYSMFINNAGENRPLDYKGRRRLIESMKTYGFIDSLPIVVCKDSKGRLVVKDGQHRLSIAESLGLPVYYVEDTTNFDPSIISSGGKPWVPKDYAMKYSASGIQSYTEGLAFAKQYGLPIGSAFALLAGTVSFGNCEESFKNGTFKIKDKEWADSVASLYVPLTKMSKAVANNKMLEACMAVCRVPDFDRNRLLAGAERCREKLVSYGNKEANLDLLETLYNFGRKYLVGLKAAAIMAMRERSAAKSKTGQPATKAKSSINQAAAY